MSDFLAPTLSDAGIAQLVSQLNAAMGVLTQGRQYGIRVVATPEGIESILASAHPAAQEMVANMAVVSQLP